MKAIISKLKRKTQYYLNLDNNIRQLQSVVVSESNKSRLLLGKMLVSDLLKKGRLNNIQDAEFKIFSQWGDDGIIQYIISRIDVPRTFIDIGAGRYTQPDTRFLLENNNWSGVAIDGCSVDSLINSEIYPLYDITAVQSFVTAENVNDLISYDEVGLLNIDIDGNDYWVWKAIKKKPVIVIVEYNPYFGLRPITVPYRPDFVRGEAHHSNMFYGTSLISLCDLAKEKGYTFIGCNSNGGNAYFIRNDMAADFRSLTAEEGYIPTKSREHRDKDGELTFMNPNTAKESFRGLDVYNTKTNKIEKF